MKAVGKASRKALSPLLAIIIGLVVTIVAGILLAQLYFSYAATISTRPAANVEYIDLVYSGGGSGILVVNVKNMGGLRITDMDITDSGATINCNNPQGVPTPGGGVASITCSVSGISLGGNVTATLTVNFEDGSVQSYAIAARARAP